MIRRVLKPAEAEDLLVGDMVQAPNGVGLVESIDNDHATIAYDCDRRDILPLSTLRRCEQGGSDLDRMGR